MVQLSWPSSWCCQSGLHNLANGTGNCGHAHPRRWSLHFRAVREPLRLASLHSLTDQCRKAYQTVLLAIFVLCMFGTICSFPTNWLHRIILWFAPINSMCNAAHLEPLLTLDSHCINLHMHRSSHSYTEQTKCAMGVYNSHRWLWLAKQGLFLPARVCATQHVHAPIGY